MTNQGEIRQSSSDTDLPTSSSATDPALVSKGTPGGELLRRYWHPIAVAADVQDLPIPLRVLGEDLILFKTPLGRFGLVSTRCVHRGTTLLYGKIAASAVRCGYYGWLFDREGRCLNQPCEINTGRQLDGYRQPWYPIKERYGLIFAYLGPLDRQPPLPRYDLLEDIPDGFHLLTDGITIPSENTVRSPCNWFQLHTNVFDYTRVQLVCKQQFPRSGTIPLKKMEFALTNNGICAKGVLGSSDGSTIHFVSEVILPTVRIVPDLFVASLTGHMPITRIGSNNVAWTLPIDDTNTQIFTALITPKSITEFPLKPPLSAGKTAARSNIEKQQQCPDNHDNRDAITDRTDENLAALNRGTLMFRTIYQQAIEMVQAGNNPPNAFGSDDILVKSCAISEFSPIGRDV